MTKNVKKRETGEMKRSLLRISLVMLVLFAFVQRIGAEEAKPAGTLLEDIKKALGISIYVQGGYLYNFKNPDAQENELRVFDHKGNSFTLDLAQLVFVREAPVGGIGYKVKLSAGETAKFIHSAGLGKSDDPFDITEAYVDYVAPVGKGLKLRFGKFVTMHGAEVIEAKDNFNYSRSLLFNFAIPFTHTGLMAGYAFSDQVNANLYLVNGWDNTDDNNKGKTAGVTVGYTPMEQIALTFNLMYGPEQDNNTSNKRFLFDWVATIKPVKDLTLAINTDYATEQKATLEGTDARWYGVAGYAKYDFSDLFSLTLRAEYFKDKDGVRTGTAQAAKEITLTPEFRVAKAVIVRPEYRHDWSDKEVFDSARKKTQDTIALGVMYTW